MQVKTTMRYHFAPVRMALMKKDNYWRCGKIGTLCTLLVGKKNGPADMENNMNVPQKIKIKPPYDTAIPLLSIYPKEF